MLRKRVLFVKKAISVKVRGLYSLERESQKGTDMEKECLLYYAAVTSVREWRNFGCVSSGLEYVRYSPNVFISELTEFVNGASVFTIH